MSERKFNFSINEGDAFFAHETSINFGPSQFILDFKCITPRTDVRSQQAPMLALKHNVIMLEPYGVMEFASALTDMVKKYEKEFGKIVKSDAVRKFERKMKNKRDKGKGEEPLAYMG